MSADHGSDYRAPGPPMDEPKPEWSDVPAALKQAIADLVGARITESSTVYGGFGPSATFRLKVADGRELFSKGAHPGHTDYGSQACVREAELYTALPELQDFGPGFHGTVEDGEWRLVVLDYVESRFRVPPWTERSYRSTMETIARFHQGMPVRARDILDDAESSPLMAGIYRADNGWSTLLRSEEDRDGFATLFADRDAARAWLDGQLPRFAALEGRASRLGGPRSWVHHDLRSDNLLFREEDAPLILDWPYLSIAPVIVDLVSFLPSACGEGALQPEVGIRLYEDASGWRFDEQDLQVAFAMVAGYFAARAWKTDVAGLPRLRWVQRLQLFPSLEWLSRVLEIEGPPPPAIS